LGLVAKPEVTHRKTGAVTADLNEPTIEITSTRRARISWAQPGSDGASVNTSGLKRRRIQEKKLVSPYTINISDERLATTYNIVHWSEMSSGGHFAALEQPDLMLADLRAFVSTVAGDGRHE
jgi:hypothetical protein